jgi:transposase InsO family protein
LVQRHTTGGPILRSYSCGVRQLLGHRLGTLVDHMSRESPAIEVDRSLSGRRVVAVLERLAATPRLTKTPLVDHGPEFTAKALEAWAHRHSVQLAFSRPGTPTDHPVIEASNARFWEEGSHPHGLGSLEEARPTIEDWRVEYHTERPHTALGHQVPAGYNAGCLQTQATQAASDSPDRWIKRWVRTTPWINHIVTPFSNTTALPSHG